MTVLAAALISKTGKPLVSRQYLDMSRIRIEGLLAAFPKLVGSGKQHTYVETENVRYIYQPMEGLYLVVITNKQSNILEDLDTLRLLSKLVPEYTDTLDEEDVVANAFELVSAFDEVISLGYKENVSVMQVKQNCEMESHEEKLHKMIILSKINETKDVMKKKALEIDKVNIANKSKTGFGSGSAGGMSGFGGGRPSTGVAPEMSSVRPDPVPVSQAPKPSASAAVRGPSKGMQLGKGKGKGGDVLAALAKEGEVDMDTRPAAGAAAASGMGSMASSASEPVTLVVEEKLSVQLSKEGGCESLEVQGTMSLVVNSDEGALMRIAVKAGANKNFQFKTHPNIDKALYSSSSVLGLKDASRPFPIGSELGVLKWRMQTKDESLVPITINCWPSVSGGETFVNIEYESASSMDLHNVEIAIPLPGHAPTVNQADGEWRFDSKRNCLLWTLDLIDDSNRSGSMEFVVAAADPSVFYPIDVTFSSKTIFADVHVDTVEHTQSGAPVKFSFKKFLTTAEYTVE
ncbi:hypothetical protein FOA52_000489 [Chlamydomonas sp. UWO 241]|nr:hypothetical protein FOA52_000489 [Chlamydomonas sp. UWO 241]